MMLSQIQSSKAQRLRNGKGLFNEALASPDQVLAAYLENPSNRTPRRIENFKAYTNRFEGFWLKQVKVAGLGWERFAWSPEAEQLSQDFADLPTDFPPIILNPFGLVHDGAHRVRAAEIRGDETIWAYVPIGEAAPL